MKSNYDVHGLLRVAVDSADPDMHEGYRHYLRYFETDAASIENHYEVRDYSQFKPPATRLNSNEFFRFKEGVCFPREKYALSYDGKKFTEYTTYPNRATNFWLQILFLNKGMSFIHSAAVEINGKGFIFPAFGGVGKTTLISSLRKWDNVKVFGDDFVLVGKEGSMLAYPSDLSIYDYHVPLFPELKGSSYARFLWRVKYFYPYYWCKKAINFFIRRLNLGPALFFKGWNASYVKVPTAAVIAPEKIGRKTQIAASIFLERFSGDQIEKEEISIEELVKINAAVLSLEFTVGIPFFNALATVADLESSLFYTKQKEIIQSAFSKTKCFRIRIPEKLPVSDYLDYLKDFVKSLSL